MLENIWDGGQFLTVFVRTFVFVAIALALALLIGYPVAYFAARHAGRWKGLVLVLLILPFWINYLMRMLAWINLLSPDGWATRALHCTGVDRLFMSLGLLSARAAGSRGSPSTVIIALVYGYVPFLILPLFAVLDRIDQRQIEAARDLGGEPVRSVPAGHPAALDAGVLAGDVLIALPMFGDYYTPDLVSASPKTSLIGNQIDQLTRQGSEKVVGAVLTLLLAVRAARADALLPARDPQADGGGGKRHELASAIPGAGRASCCSSRVSTSSGRSSRWRSRSCSRSTTGARGRRGRASRRAGSPARPAACSTTPRCRERSSTRCSSASSASSSRRRSASRSRSVCSAGAAAARGTVNTLMLLPLVTPEIVMGVSLLLLFLQVLPGSASAPRRRRSVR